MYSLFLLRKTTFGRMDGEAKKKTYLASSKFDGFHACIAHLLGSYSYYAHAVEIDELFQRMFYLDGIDSLFLNQLMSFGIHERNSFASDNRRCRDEKCWIESDQMRPKKVLDLF